jgi:DNA-binding NarL/FixJ family response regulator
MAKLDEARPAVLLTDVVMPGINGLQLAERVTKKRPEVRVAVLTGHLNEQFLLQAVRTGVSGFLVKGASGWEIEFAVRAIARGDKYFSPWASGILAQHVRTLGICAGPAQQLTQRQREILKLTAEGRSAKEIASDLRISRKTVDTHRGILMGRLQIHDVAGLTRFAIRNGLASAD